jgi:hypothetical protein
MGRKRSSSVEPDDRHYLLVAGLIGDGALLPFLGAGASLCDRPDGAEWEQGRYLPSAWELGRLLAERSRYPLTTSCERLGEQAAFAAKPADHHMTAPESHPECLQLLAEDPRERLEGGGERDGRGEEACDVELPADRRPDVAGLEREELERDVEQVGRRAVQAERVVVAAEAVDPEREREQEDEDQRVLVILVPERPHVQLLPRYRAHVRVQHGSALPLRRHQRRLCHGERAGPRRGKVARWRSARRRQSPPR